MGEQVNNVTTKEFQDLIRESYERPGIDVFVDTNILLSAKARSVWARDIDRTLITRQIIHEVRKRPKNKTANQFIEDCRASKRVLSRDGCPYKHALDFLTVCAMRVPPAVRNALREQIDLYGQPKDMLGRHRLVDRVLQKIRNEDESLLATPEHRKELLRHGLVPESGIEASKSLKKSWHSYLSKRVKKEAEGPYLYTDERIAAFALANSLLFNRPSVIVSSDYDYAVIFKQLIDNIIENASIGPDGEVDSDKFQSLVHSIERLGLEREFRQLGEAYRTGGDACSIAPQAGEVLVVIPRVRESLYYCFGNAMKRYLLDMESALREDDESANALADHAE